MKKIEIYHQSDYRRLLDELLLVNELSYRSLAKACPEIISFPLLAKVLIKDSHGVYKGHQNLSPEKLALLLNFFGYSQDEIQFGLLLRFENDIRTLPHQRGSLAKAALRKAVQSSRRQRRSRTRKTRVLSPVAQLLGELFDQFPAEARPRILRTLVRQAAIATERTKDIPGSARLRALLAEFKKLT